MRFKKIASVFLASLMAATLVACGGSASSAGTAGAESGGSAGEPSGNTGEKVKLVVWNAGMPDSDDSGVIAKEDMPFNKFNKQFMEENNVELEISGYGMDQMSQLMTAATMSGDLPDVIILWAGSSTNDFSEILVNLEDYMSAEEIAQYSALEICRQGMTSEGHLQALPFGLTTYGAYYNKEVFANAGITEMPETWDEFIEIGHILKESGVVPVVLDNTGYSDTWVMSEFLADEMGPAGITDLKDGTVKMADEMPVRLLNEWRRLYTEGLVNEGSSTTDSVIIDEMFQNGKAAIRFNGSWNHKNLVNDMGDNVGVFQIPAISADAPFAKGLVSQPGLNAVVTVQSKNPEMAVKYIQYITSGEFQTENAAISGDIPSISTADTSRIDNPLTQESYSWLANGDAVIGFDSVISAEAGTEFYRNVVVFFSGKMTAEELGKSVDDINLKS